MLLVGNDPEYFLMHRLPLAQALAQEGVDLHVVVPFESNDRRFHSLQFELHRLHLRRGSVNPFAEARAAAQLATISRRLRPQLVHHVTIKPVLYGSLVARMLGTPAVVNSITGLGYVFASPDTAARCLRAVLQPLMRHGCMRPQVTMLFENRDDLDLYRSLRIANGAHSHVVPSSGIDPAAFVPRQHRDGAVTVMLLGRMLRDKGVLEFVAAARKIRKERPQTRFVLVGGTDPNPESISEATLRSWQEEGVVEYWGWRSDVGEVLRSADILCLPSYREGLPRALLEGGAAGLALVATDVPGCRDAVRTGSTGVIVPPRDVDALADAIMDFVDDTALRAAMGAAARADVAARFSVASVIEHTMGIYREALGRASTTAG